MRRIEFSWFEKLGLAALVCLVVGFAVNAQPTSAPRAVPVVKVAAAADTPNAEMLAKKQEWDTIYGPTLVDLHEVGVDFGYKAARVTMPFNTWQISYGFASGPFAGAPLRTVTIGQFPNDPSRFLWNYSVDDNRTNMLTR